jgi:flagellar basal-body rod protein FlgF
VKINSDNTVDTSKVGNFALTGVKKSGDSYFTGTAAGKGTGEIRSGYLEGSGVEAGRVMVDMMASMRAYEAGQKAIQTIDGSLQQAAGTVGNLPS